MPVPAFLPATVAAMAGAGGCTLRRAAAARSRAAEGIAVAPRGASE